MKTWQGTIQDYIPAAEEYLKERRFTKAWKLGQALGISPHMAGHVLKALKDWDLWNKARNRRRRLWYNVNKVVIDE